MRASEAHVCIYTYNSVCVCLYARLWGCVCCACTEGALWFFAGECFDSVGSERHFGHIPLETLGLFYALRQARKRLVDASFADPESVFDYSDLLCLNAPSLCLHMLDAVYHGPL